jgi:hypothetical protein
VTGIAQTHPFTKEPDMFRRLLIPAFALALAAPAMTLAQENTERGRDRDRGERRDDNQGGQDRRAEFRERMANWMKERLGATDEEMKVISPKLEKVMAARRDTGGFGGGGRGPFGGRRDDDNETLTPSQQASRDLNTTLENKNATAEEIAAKLKALREARAKAKESLAAAQKDLKEVLTQRQEAVLVEMGMLE